MRTLSRKQYVLVILACSGMATSALGLIVNVNGVFFGPVSQSLHVGRGAVSLAATLTALATGFMGPVAVKALERYPIRRIMMMSVAITVLCTIGMAWTSQIWMFDLLSIARGASSAFFGVPVVTLLMGNWFVKSRGMLTGMVMSCSGLAGAIMAPILSKIIEGFGYKVGYILCAILILLSSFPAMAFLQLSPEYFGGKAYGAEAEKSVSEKKNAADNEVYLIWKPVSVFYICLAIIAFFCQSVCSISQHLAGYAESVGQSSATGAMMISAAMVGNITAKFVAGVLSDKLGAFRSAFILIFTFFVGLVGLVLVPSQESVLLAGSFLLGTSYACALMLSNLIFEIYGTEQYGAAYSLLMVILNVGGALAITVVGCAYDIFKSYSIILWVGSFISVISVVLLTGILGVVKKKRRKQ